jgi:hypothetical protein
VVVAFTSAYRALAASLLSLFLAASLTACQGIVRESGEQVPRGSLSVSPRSLSFGNVIVGKVASLTGSVQATGAAVAISSVRSTSSEFAVSGLSLPTSLDSGQNLSFTVTFTPQVSGAASASLSFASDAENSPTVQPSEGMGQPAPAHSVDLAWISSNSPGIVGYNVYRGTGGPYSRINDILEATTSYSDEQVNAGTTYYYVVTAIDDSDVESGYSKAVAAVVPNP